MSKIADFGVYRDYRRPEYLNFAASAVAAAVGWLLAAGGLISTVLAVPRLGWQRSLWVAALCAAPPAALWLTRAAIASWRIRAVVSGPLREQRCYGSLEALAQAEQRSLRSIATTAYEVAGRTGRLLAEMTAVPGVRIFHGLRSAGAALPLIPHAVSAGRHLVLIESVAWPPGSYETMANGRVCCDGTWIGQSVQPFLAAVGQWRAAVPKSHRVSAMIIVHPGAGSEIRLPASQGDDLSWVRAEDAVSYLRGCLVQPRRGFSQYLLAALISATEDQAIN